MKNKLGEIIGSPWSHKRDDFNPRPELPVLLVVCSGDEAEKFQRILNPKEFHVMAFGGALTGHRFRMIITVLDPWLRLNYQSDRAMSSYYDFMDHLRTKLATGCEQYFIVT